MKRRYSPISARCVVVVCGLICAVLPSGCAMCGNDEIRRSQSPDGTLEAVVFQRDCGATTGFSTQVSIVTTQSTLPNSGGNTWIADCDHGAAPSAPWGGPPIRIKWTGSRELMIEYDHRTRVFSSPPSVDVSTGLFSKATVLVAHETTNEWADPV